jgi:hypothetical protein
MEGDQIMPPPLNVGDSNGGSRVEANLIRLTYVSTFYPFVTDDTISNLVAKAAEFNREHHITGVLAVEGARVCQILEGPTEAVDALFASIQRDDRHHTVVQIEHRVINKSSFEDWGMVRRQMVDMVTFALTS